MTPTILCVDDEKIVLDSLKAQLNAFFDHECFVEIAESGEEALEVISDLLEENGTVPNVLISDQLMPGMKGNELMAIVKKKYPKICTILLTGQAQKKDIVEAINYGQLYRYIPKPWDTQDLNLTVKEALTSTLLSLELEVKHEELIQLNINLELKVEERTEEIRRKRKELDDSINYAKRIQTVLLPSEEQLTDMFSEHFVFYKPLNKVSGDFYWVREENNKLYFALGDCTGHGVPGAMLSMLSMEILNSVVINNDLSTGEILEILHKIVVKELKQKSSDINDGMDICLVCKDLTTGKFTYSGASAGPVTIKDGEITCHKYNRLSIGGLIELERDYETYHFDLNSGDKIYLSSDGFKDQFGGERNKKFSSKRLRNLILKNHALPLIEQKKVLANTISEWQGNHDQIDDMTVFAIKLK